MNKSGRQQATVRNWRDQPIACDAVSTVKRARQKANRASRVAAAQAAEAKARTRRQTIRWGSGVAVIVILIVGIGWFLNRGDDDPFDGFDPVVTDTTQPEEISEPSNPDCPAADKSSPRTLDFGGPQPMCINPVHNYQAVFDTSEGEILIDLDTENTPNTVNNFVTLARWGYYDGTTLFRTDPSIDIIQGGSPHTDSASDPGPGYTIPDEPTFNDDGGFLTGPYRYVPGQLVMARSGGPDASGAQFFFTTGNNTSRLDSSGTYIVFGQTDEAGLGVMQDIIGLHQPDDSGLGGRPSRTVTVNSVTIRVG